MSSGDSLEGEDDTAIQSRNADDDNDMDEDEASSPPLVQGVTLKLAVDAHGGAAELRAKKSERFTCAASLDMVHRLRAQSDAVLVGRGTVVMDNPSLLVRRGIVVEEQPLRVVLDPTLSLLLPDDDDDDDDSSKTYQILTDGFPTVIYHCQPDTDDSLLDLHEEGSVTVQYLEPTATTTTEPAVNHNGSCLLSTAALVQDLRQRFGIEHLMVEGGPATAQQFLRERQVDRCLLVRARTVEFVEPLPSGIDADFLRQNGLVHRGTVPSGGGVDEIECWSRPELDWPSNSASDGDELGDWP